MKRILALQGGGVLGKGQAVALRELELDSGRPLCAMFDLVGGTSVGAIIGAAVAVGLPMKAVNEFFDVAAPKIFAGNWWNSVSQLWGAKYNANALEAGLKELFGTHTLEDCKTKFICTAFDCATGRNVYFQSYGQAELASNNEVIITDLAIPLWEICRASAAAQTYFPAFQFTLAGGGSPLVLIDGGNTGCNAPDMLCLAEALNAGTSLAEIKMLSIGSGRVKWDLNGKALVNPSVLRAALATIKIVFAGGERNAVWQAASLLDQNHFRLESDLGTGCAIDDARPATLHKLELAMETAIAQHLELIQPFLA